MRVILSILLLSSPLFAQNTSQQTTQAAQMAQQAAQTAMQQTHLATQQAVRDAQLQNDAAVRAQQQMTDIAVANATRNANAQANKNVKVNVTRTPSFSPKPGTYKGIAPQITITDTTKGAAIYFTTDGSSPTAQSQLYTGPIALSATTIIKATAIAPSFAQSPIATGQYKVQ